MKNLSVYLHIPFCIKKCKYCDFLSYPASEREQEDYAALLGEEIERQSLFYKDYQVISVFIGGGTPSVLENRAIEAVFKKLKENYIFDKSPEITIEVNPGTVDEEKLRLYLRLGINRLSIGLQSANDGELRTLGRIHDYHTFLETYELARRLGFNNINIDLISAVPGQSVESYRETLRKVLALDAEHISAYSLIKEEGTWFYEHSDELKFPTEDEDRQMYCLTEKMLSDHGYHRYEISNYAKDGFECIHNKVYWKRGDYVGFGMGAASLVDETRFSNNRTLEEYAGAVRALRGDCAGREAPEKEQGAEVIHDARSRLGEDIQRLSVTEQMEEFMFLGLRLTEGVSKKEFFEKFGVPMDDIYGETLNKLRRKGLIITDGNVRLTPYGTDISNYVMSEFIF